MRVLQSMHQSPTNSHDQQEQALRSFISIQEIKKMVSDGNSALTG